MRVDRLAACAQTARCRTCAWVLPAREAQTTSRAGPTPSAAAPAAPAQIESIHVEWNSFSRPAQVEGRQGCAVGRSTCLPRVKAVAGQARRLEGSFPARPPTHTPGQEGTLNAPLLTDPFRLEAVTPKSGVQQMSAKGSSALGSVQSLSFSGSARSLFPVSANIALAIAGATGGTATSPMPVGSAPLSIRAMSTAGMSLIRGCR